MNDFSSSEEEFRISLGVRTRGDERGRGAVRARGVERGRGDVRGRGGGRGRGGARGGSGGVRGRGGSRDHSGERGRGGARGGRGGVRGRGVVSGRYDIGMKVRKKFKTIYFDGEIVSKYVDSGSNMWHVKYTDGDSEDLSEDELKVHIKCYNNKYNH